MNMNIHPIKQRPRYFPAIPFNISYTTGTFPATIAKKSTRTSVQITTLAKVTSIGSVIDQQSDMQTPGDRIRWARIQKGLLIKTVARKVGISPVSLSQIENNHQHTLEQKTLRNLAIVLEQPIWFLGCFENMPEATFLDRFEKARCYRGHTKMERAAEIGMNARTIFDWKHKEPDPTAKEKALLYCKILVNSNLLPMN